MSDLLAMSLIRQNIFFQSRVQSALVNLAREQIGAPDSHGLFAAMIMADPQKTYPEFVINASTSTLIQDATVVSEDASFVVTTNVQDQHIIDSVQATYWEVSSKYAPVETPTATEEEDGSSEEDGDY